MLKKATTRPQFEAVAFPQGHRFLADLETFCLEKCGNWMFLSGNRECMEKMDVHIEDLLNVCFVRSDICHGQSNNCVPASQMPLH